MLHRRRTATLAASLVCIVMIAGCGSDTQASPKDDAASSSASPDSSTAPPTPPAEAEGSSDEAAKAFTGYWVESLNYATASGDTAALKKLASKNCTSCADFAGTLDQIYGAGGDVESKGWDLQNAVPIAGQPTTKPALRMDVLVSPQQVTEREGAKAKPYDGGPQAMTIFLVRRGDAWLVDRLDIAA